MDLALSLFQKDIDVDSGVIINLKYPYKWVDGSVIWASLGTAIDSSETWNRLLQHKSEIVEIGVFIGYESTMPVKSELKRIRMGFFIAQSNSGDSLQIFVFGSPFT